MIALKKLGAMNRLIIFIVISWTCIFVSHLEAMDKNKKVIFSVSGHVKQSTVIEINDNITFEDALKLCGGLDEKASKKYIHIYRFDDSGELDVIMISYPKDSKFIIKHRDMVVVRDKVYWSRQFDPDK